MENTKIDYSWQKQSNCSDLDPSMFYPSHGQRYAYEAVEACYKCPVKEECLQHALQFEEYGYWAGTSPNKRVAMRKKLGIKLVSINSDFLSIQYVEEIVDPEKARVTKAKIIRRQAAVCGTRAGYNAHRRRNEPTCADCKRAQTHSVIDYKKKKKQEKEEAQS
jgi:hypothetical protein